MAPLTELPFDQCLELLRATKIGRVGCTTRGGPVILPVTFQLVEFDSVRWIAFRTRRGNVVDLPGTQAAFEIDEIDEEHHSGWSVLVRGTVARVDPDAADFRERFNPGPWADGDRDSWLAIEPFSISGRALVIDEFAWWFDPSVDD